MILTNSCQIFFFYSFPFYLYLSISLSLCSLCCFAFWYLSSFFFAHQYHIRRTRDTWYNVAMASLRGWRLFGVAGTIVAYVCGILLLSIISLNNPHQRRMRSAHYSDVRKKKWKEKKKKTLLSMACLSIDIVLWAVFFFFFFSSHYFFRQNFHP